MASEMDLPHISPTTKDAATNNRLPVPATPIACRHCSRQFATISVDTGLVPYTQQEQVCTFCDPFLELYETLQTKESEHTALLDRGPKHHGRALAHRSYISARVALENFLMAVDAPHDSTISVAQAGSATRVEPVQLERTDDPAAGVAHEHGDDQQALEGGPAPDETVSSLKLKRKLGRRSDASVPDRKRTKFTETVEERSQYRSTEEFNRGAKGYIPGRYVAAEGSEFLDTSGSSISFTKFTGQKKKGSLFVDVVPKNKVQEGEDEHPVSLKKGRGKGKKTQGRDRSPETEQTESQTDISELTASRRSRSTTPPATTRPRRTVAQYDGVLESPTTSPGKPSLVVVLKLCRRPDVDTSEAVQGPTRLSERIESRHQSPADSISHDPVKQNTEVAKTKELFTSIHRASSGLQVVASSKYTDVISAAVHNVEDSFKSLTALDKAGCKVPSSTSHSTERPERNSVLSQRSSAATGIGEICNGDANLALDATVLDRTPRRDELDALSMASLETTSAVRDTEKASLVPPIENPSSLPSVNQTYSRFSLASAGSGITGRPSAQPHVAFRAVPAKSDLSVLLSSGAPLAIHMPSSTDSPLTEEYLKPGAAPFRQPPAPRPFCRLSIPCLLKQPPIHQSLQEPSAPQVVQEPTEPHHVHQAPPPRSFQTPSKYQSIQQSLPPQSIHPPSSPQFVQQPPVSRSIQELPGAQSATISKQATS